MLKLSLIAWLLCSLAWRTTPTSCRQTEPPPSIQELLANQLQSYMDTTTRPCENFYQYACGNWQLHQEEEQPQQVPQQQQEHQTEKQQQKQQQHHQHREHKDQLQPSDTLAVLDYGLNRQLEQLLRRPVANESSAEEAQPEQPVLLAIQEKMRNYYRACKRLKPYNLKKYLQHLPPGNESGWPLLSRNWQPERFNWLATIGRLRLYGLNGVLLREEVLPRWDDSSSYSIYLDKPNWLDTTPMGEGAMIELLLDIGQTKRVANELARQVDALERQLHRLHELEDDEGAKEMQLGYLAELMPQFPWLSYIQQLRNDADLLSTLIIQNIPYMRALDDLLQRHQLETICNYIMLKLLAFLKRHGPAEISRVECMASLRRAMPLATSFFIGQRFYDASSEPLVEDIFSRLKLRFGQLLSENRLQLQQPIVQALRDKLQAMRVQLGFVQLNDSGYVEDYYERVQLNAHNFYGNQLALLRLRVEQSHELLAGGGGLADANNVSYLIEHWLSSSSSPLYVKPRNLVLVPYGLLQLPIFHRNMSGLQQHAMLGFALAHELIHAYDSSGIDYDSVGNSMGPSEEISANPRFVQGLNCMQQQLATGSRSLNEKMADYEALRLVYETYFGDDDVWPDRKEPRDPLLPQFSQRQRFFISFAQFFCGKPQRLSLHEQHLEHAVDELRVLQTLANFEEFSREFGCEKRTKMQAKQKCRVW